MLVDRESYNIYGDFKFKNPFGIHGLHKIVSAL